MWWSELLANILICFLERTFIQRTRNWNVRITSRDVDCISEQMTYNCRVLNQLSPFILILFRIVLRSDTDEVPIVMEELEESLALVQATT